MNKINMRLIKLEESFFSLSKHLEGERVLRKVDDDKCKQLCDFLSQQIVSIKEKQPPSSFNESFLSLKEELLNIIDTKIDSKLLENKKELEIQYINNIEKINKNKNSENWESKILDKELSQYRFELNKLNKKIENIDNAYSQKLKEIRNKMDDNLKLNNDDLSNKIQNLNIAITQLKNEQKNNINKINNNIREQLNSINNIFESKINNIHINSNDIDLNNIDNNLSILKSNFDSLSNNYLREIDDLKKNINNQNILKYKEINNFEEHLLEEYEKFTKFITDILNQNVDKIKAINEFMNSDIEIVKNKNQYLEETLLKMREDIFDSLEKNIKYVLDKVHSYMDIQNVNISPKNEKDEINSNEE